MAIFQGQLFQNGKKQTGSIISEKFPITNSDYFIYSIISDQTLFSSQKFVNSIGFSIEKKLTIISDSSKSEISDKNTSLNQFKPVGDHLSEIIHLKKSMVLQNHNFSSIPCKSNIQYYLAKNLNIPAFKTM